MFLLVYILSILTSRAFGNANGKLEEPKIILLGEECELTSISKNTAECTNIYYLCTEMLSNNVMLKYSCPANCCFDAKILQCICKKQTRRISTGQRVSGPIGRKFGNIDYSESNSWEQTTEPWWINRTTTDWGPTKTTKPTPTTSTTTSRPPETGEFKCPKDNGNGYPLEYPDPNDCCYFFICYSEDIMVRYDCGGGWYFTGEECDEGVCPTLIPGSQPLDPKPSNCPILKFACPDLEYLSQHPDPNDCNFYFTCEHGYILRRDQCEDGEHFEGGECVEGSCPTSVRDCGVTPETPAPTAITTTTTSKPIQTGEFECPEWDGGYSDEYPDPNDCQYFWICYSKDIMARYKCGDDQYFNGDKCVLGDCPDAIPGAKPLDPKDPGCEVEEFECPSKNKAKHPDPNDCKFYFECNNYDIISRRECEDGKYFEGERCLKGKCPSTIRDTCGIETTTTSPTTTERECKTDEFECPEDRQDEFPLYLADPNDCTYFHICYSLEKAVRLNCGPEAYFDGKMCVEGLCPDTLPGCKPQEPPGGMPTTTIRPPATGEFECPNDAGYGNPNEYPDPNDCQYFWICYSKNIMVRYKCGDDQYFNGEKCVPGDCPDAIPGAKPLDPKDPGCEVETFECPTKKNKKYPDPNDCKFYFQCKNGDIISRQECPDGEHFENSKCCEGECPSTIRDSCDLEPPSNGKFQCPDNVGDGEPEVFPDPYDCRYFFICYTRDIMLRLNCAEDYHFNGECCVPGECPNIEDGAEPLEPGKTDCEVETFECPSNTEKTEFVDPNDCNYYFVCDNTGIYSRNRCDDGEHYEEWECVDGECPSTIRDRCDRDCQVGNFLCPEDREDEFPLQLVDPNDCNYFHICYSLEKAVRLSCGPEAHFDGEMCVEGSCQDSVPGCAPLNPPGTPTTPKPTTTTRKPTTTTKTPTTTTSRPPFTGYFDCTDKIGVGQSQEFPDPNDCQYFWVCYNEDIMARLKCGNDQYFNGAACVSGECPTKIPGAKPLKPKPTDCNVVEFKCPDSKPESRHADPNDCNYFFICMNGDIIVRSICEGGEHFEGGKCIGDGCESTVRDCGVTTEPPPVTTTRKPPCNNTGGGGGGGGESGEGSFIWECPIRPAFGFYLHPNPENCRYYLNCTADQVIKDDCGAGRHLEDGYCEKGECPDTSWSHTGEVNDCRMCEKGRWDCPEKPKNGDKPIQFEDPNDCRYYYDCYSSGAFRQDCGEGKYFEKGECRKGECEGAVKNCKPLDQGRDCLKEYFVCPPGSDGRKYPDENDCRYYFYCANYMAQRFDCGVGRHFGKEGICQDGKCSYALPNCQPQEVPPGPDSPPHFDYPNSLTTRTPPPPRPPTPPPPSPKVIDCGSGNHFSDGWCSKGPCPKICRYR